MLNYVIDKRFIVCNKLFFRFFFFFAIFISAFLRLTTVQTKY